MSVEWEDKEKNSSRKVVKKLMDWNFNDTGLMLHLVYTILSPLHSFSSFSLLWVRLKLFSVSCFKKLKLLKCEWFRRLEICITEWIAMTERILGISRVLSILLILRYFHKILKTFWILYLNILLSNTRAALLLHHRSTFFHPSELKVFSYQISPK